MRRLGPVALALVIAAGGCAAVALAADSRVSGDWGGGTALEPPGSPFGPGNATVSLNSSGNGTVNMHPIVAARCAITTFDAEFKPVADGSFATTGSSAERREDGSRVSVIYAITGTIDNTRASGTLEARIKVTKSRRKTRRCTTGPLQWSARQRRVGIDIGTPAAVAPGRRLYGSTKQLVQAGRHSIVVHVSPDGKSLSRVLYGADFSCGSDVSEIIDAPSDNVPIRPDGTFSDVERYSVKFDRRTRGRFTDRFSGRIGSAGATGKFKLTGTFIDIPSGRTFERCRSGTVPWTALP